MLMKSMILGAALAVAASAQATVFTVKWSGAGFGNDASAIGHFDINTAAFPELGGNQTVPGFPNPDFQLLDLTVSGAAAGNGSFTERDFAGFTFAAFSPLNYSQELMGQAMTNGCTFGDFGACYGGPSGDFNLFNASAAAPNGTFYFALTADGGYGDSMAVTSILAVPEPASWALMLVGFAVVGVAARRGCKSAPTA